MKNVKIVIGAGYGDEGKGKIVDYLSQEWADLVVRFSSSCQAAHTVIKKDGRSHVFGHIGSGTFNDVPTYLSSKFVVHPRLFLKELKVLRNKGADPKVFVNENCYVSTPYDVLINQIAERYRVRESKAHGSCGIGFNETVTRCFDRGHILNVGMLLSADKTTEYIYNFLTSGYIDERLAELGVPVEFIEEQMELMVPDHNSLIEKLMVEFETFIEEVSVVGQSDDFILDVYDNVVFEGAQGLLLDEKHEWFPHVTRSRTGIKNVDAILQNHKLNSVEICYVTRAYATRHGNGPFPNENELPYEIIDKTNRPNEFQGSLRLGYLDVDLLVRSIENDLQNYTRCGRTVVNVYMTCVDQVDEHFVCIFNGEQMYAKAETLAEYVIQKLNVGVLMSGSPVTPDPGRMKVHIPRLSKYPYRTLYKPEYSKEF